MLYSFKVNQILITNLNIISYYFSEYSDLEDHGNIDNLSTELLIGDQDKISGNLMESYHDIIHKLSDSDEKSDRELVADRAV